MSSIPSLEWECFLTHDWGTKEDGHANHKRVGEVYRALKAVGFNNWFDDVAMSGDITSAMRKGIDGSKCAIIFITKRYLEKINKEDTSDNCFQEFKYIFLQKKPFVLVLMDGSVRQADINKGYAAMKIGDVLYIDMSKNLNIDALVVELKKKGIQPSTQVSNVFFHFCMT